MSDRNDDYLWDRSGPPDRDIVELERLLGGYALAGDAVAPAPPRWSLLRRLSLLAAALAVIAIGWWAWLGSDPAADFGADGAPPLVAGGVRLGVDEWFTATTTDNHLAIGDVGQIDLEPGSRLQVKRVGADETRLYLERGRLHAVVAVDVRPRFFQVDTPSGRCVDLGCMYDLDVDENGDAHVEVSLGQIAFESGDRDVYVPRGAECIATKQRGLGTPRFSDCDPAIAKLVAMFDREPDRDRRADIANKLTTVIDQPRDSLTLWHLLRDSDPRIAATAERRLIDVAGHPDAAAGTTLKDYQPVDSETWRNHLEDLWW